ncbi:MAG: class I SAM-dependent methyltransferase [Endomicrobia bacterium]|nr:class I SAM-dependent methyltransferase [Bacillota bacterium]MCL1971404.1 class I SAM-dependent methyltransferase [Endomicrobiia bacterium]
MLLKKSFDSIAYEYDKQRKQIIPCFDDFYNLPLQIMKFKGTAPKILDLGSGTGLFSSFVINKYKNAKITLIDLSDKMLEIAGRRFANNKNIKIINADYTKYDFNEKFDFIISALSIHHLTAAEKKKLFKTCFGLLKKDGVFINADQALSHYAEIEKIFSDLWKDLVIESGMNKKKVMKAFGRTKLDKPSTAQDQLKWLKAAGFKTSDILYKYCHFCIFYARK